MAEVEPRMRWTGQVSLGNVATFVSVIVAAAIGYGQLQGQVSNLQHRIDQAQAQVDRQIDDVRRRADQERADARREIDNVQAETRRQFIEIQDALRRISEKLDGKQDKPRFGPGGTP